MKIENFELERFQSLWENEVEYNLSESGVHPLTMKEILGEDELDEMISTRLGYGHSNGSPELRRTVAQMYNGTSEKNVMVTNGSSEANLVTMLSLLDTGDELIYMIPNYLQIWGFARSLGVDVKPIPLRESLEWQIDTDELKQLFSPKTKMIAVCHPNNPTGAVVDREIIGEVVRLASEIDAYVLSDEVYRGAELDGIESPSFFGNYDKVIVNAGLSKAYRLPGLRLGWSVGPTDFINKAWETHDYTTISIGLLSDRIGRKVLQTDRRKKILSSTRNILSENLNLLKNWVDENNDLISFIPPKAGAIAYLKYSMNIRSSELVTRLKDEQDVLLVAGEWFGMDGFVRIGFGETKNVMIAALDRLNTFFAAYR